MSPSRPEHLKYNKDSIFCSHSSELNGKSVIYGTWSKQISPRKAKQTTPSNVCRCKDPWCSFLAWSHFPLKTAHSDQDRHTVTAVPCALCTISDKEKRGWRWEMRGSSFFSCSFTTKPSIWKNDRDAWGWI